MRREARGEGELNNIRNIIPKEFDQSTESRFWQAKALDVAEKIDEQWQIVMRTLRSKPNTYLIHEDYYHMVREIKQLMEKYKMI